MRILGVMPLLLVAACGGGGTEKNEAAATAAPPATGQWELATEVTAFRAADEGRPKINATVGTRATENVCVGEGERLPTLFLSGEGYECSYGTYYARNGRLNATLDCRREGLDGPIAILAEGSSQGETIEFTRSVRSALATDGDVEISMRVTGRRTGDCTAAAETGNRAG